MAGGAKINRITQISSTVLAAIRNAVNKLVTTTFTVEQLATDYDGQTLMLHPTTGDNAPVLGLKPSGTTTASYLDFYNASDQNNAGTLSIQLNDTKASIVTQQVGTGSILPLSPYSGVKQFV